MNVEDFLGGIEKSKDEPDPELEELAVDEAEGALRAGVRLSLKEYCSMTSSLRAAFIRAGNRIFRDRAGANSEGDRVPSFLELWSDELAAKIGGAA